MGVHIVGTPLTLGEFGSFTVGGRRVEVAGLPTRSVRLSSDLPDYKVDPNGTYTVEHAYVQYFKPQAPNGLPVVLVHGGGMTGSCWETTPDGRDGWLHYFLRSGRTTYVIDNVERGRAGWSTLADFADSDAPLLRTEQEAWDAFRIGDPLSYANRETYPGCTFPVDYLDELSRQQVPRWAATALLAVAALADLLQRVGECVVIAHSQGGGVATKAIARVPNRVAALVLVEPHGLPEPEEFEDAQCAQLIVAGDFVASSPLYAHLRERWISYIDELRDFGQRAEYMDLPQLGIRGNSHLPMMDRNSDVVAGKIAEWLASVQNSGSALIMKEYQ